MLSKEQRLLERALNPIQEPGLYLFCPVFKYDLLVIEIMGEFYLGVFLQKPLYVLGEYFSEEIVEKTVFYLNSKRLKRYEDWDIIR